MENVEVAQATATQALAGQDKELARVLSLDRFHEGLLRSATKIPGFQDYLGEDRTAWAEKLRSGKDEDRKFGGDDQLVVFVSWYAAQAYCVWLTMLGQLGLSRYDFGYTWVRTTQGLLSVLVFPGHHIGYPLSWGFAYVFVITGLIIGAVVA